jgi:hypothetical protein
MKDYFRMDRKSRKPTWLFLLAAVLLLAGLWWWREGHRLRLVGMVPAAKGYWAVTDGGMVVCEAGATSTRFALYDWATGRARWAVRVKAPGYGGWYSTSPSCFVVHHPYRYPLRTWSVSPDGQVLAIVELLGPCRRVRAWREGRLVSDVVVTPPADPERRLPLFHLQALNSGRVFCYSILAHDRTDIFGSQVAGPSYLIEGMRVVAQGRLPDALPAHISISPDGTAVAWFTLGRFPLQYKYATLTIRRKQLLITGTYIIRDSLITSYWKPIFVTNHAVLAKSGHLYGPSGRITAQAYPIHCGGYPHASLLAAPDPARGGYLSVIDLRTGTALDYDVSPVGARHMLVAADSRHLLVWTEACFQRPFPWLINRIPALKHAMPWMRQTLTVYAHPDRTAAVLRINDRQVRFKGQRWLIDDEAIAFAPDGHGFVLPAKGPHEALLFYRY